MHLTVEYKGQAFLFSICLEREGKRERKAKNQLISSEFYIAVIKTIGTDLETKGNFANFPPPPRFLQNLTF